MKLLQRNSFIVSLSLEVRLSDEIKVFQLKLVFLKMVLIHETIAIIVIIIYYYYYYYMLHNIEWLVNHISHEKCQNNKNLKMSFMQTKETNETKETKILRNKNENA